MAASKPEDSAEGISKAVSDQILATLYGQCIGDALGLLTEYLPKDEAIEAYGGKNPKMLTYDQRVVDFHRNGWAVGDWTDDSDQMILILQSILCNKGQVLPVDFAKRIKRWKWRGFPELGDYVGSGIGRTTLKVVTHPEYETEPEKAAKEVSEANPGKTASNGGVMRCSILGMHNFKNIEEVVVNALNNCKTTHYEPRCQASVLAVTYCIAKMLQQTSEAGKQKAYSGKEVDNLIKEAYERASTLLDDDDHKKDLWKHMSCTKLKDLHLDEAGRVGYTFKTMGAGFWALKQKDFQKAVVSLVMECGDADTNTCVGGALLACKLGLSAIPEPWITGLKHGDLVRDLHSRFVKLQSELRLPIEERTTHDDLSIEHLDMLGDKVHEEIRKSYEGKWK